MSSITDGGYSPEERVGDIESIIRSKDKYRSALNGKWEDFMDVPGMMPMTLAMDTAIHIAVYSGSKKPLEDLLAHENFEGDSPFMEDEYMKNDYGNTALHMAAVNGNFDAVCLLVKSKPNHLTIQNNVGETPLFRAAAFGWTDIVKFLASQSDQMTQDNKLKDIHRQRPDKTSILHIAVQGEHFDTALKLLKLDTSLRDMEDKNGMTCLQRLASMPSAFRSGYHMRTLTSILYLCLPNNEYNDDNEEEVNDTRADLTHLAKSINRSFIKIIKNINRSIWRFLLCLGLPITERILEAKRKHESALKLAKLLIKEDISWAKKHTKTDSSLYYSSVGAEENQENGKRMHEFALNLAKLLMKKDISWVKETKLECQPTSAEGQVPTSTQGQGESQPPTIAQGGSQSKTKNKTETPLLLATRHGILEIVRDILKVYPQAVEHCSHMGQNILHVAVKHRQREIFDHVKKMKIPMSMLVRGIDVNGYTILHHAAGLDTNATHPGPALQLQAELQWFKRVQKYIPNHYSRHVDKDENKTAELLFKENHEDQLKKSQKWIKETSQSCSAVAVLIATVVFAAAYTVPGGSNDKGIPVFLHSPFFLFFTVMDVVSLASSLTSVVMFLSILTSPCEQQDFLSSLPRKLTIGFTLLFFSVATTMLAFAATIVLIIRLNQKQWTTTLIYVAAFFPVTVFALMQFPLYVAFMGTLKVSLKNVRKFVSRLFRWKKIITKAKHIFRQRRSSA